MKVAVISHGVSAAFAFLMVAAAVPWMLDATLPKWIILWAAVLVAWIPLMRSGLRLDRIDMLALALVAWAAISIWFSADPAGSLDVLPRFGAPFLLFIALRRYDVQGWNWVVPAALAAAVFIGMTDWVPFEGFQNPNAVTLFVLIAIPLLLRSLAGILLAGGSLAYLLFFNASHHELAAFALWATILAVMVAPGDWKWPIGGLMVGITLSALVLGVHAEALVYESVATRLDMWLGGLAAWVQSPVLGTGLGTFGHVFPMHGDAALRWFPDLVPFSVEPATYTYEAHNDILQVLIELGLIGIALTAALVWVTLRESHRETISSNRIWSSLIQNLALLSLGTAGLLCLIDFPLQHPATAALVAFVAAQVAPARLMPYRDALGRSPALIGLLACWPLVLAPSMVQAEGHFSWAMTYKNLPATDDASYEALVHHNMAYNLRPGNFRIRLGLYDTAMWFDGRFPGEITETDIDNAWQISKSASPMHTALLMDRLGHLTRRGDCIGILLVGSRRGECVDVFNNLLRTASRRRGIASLIKENER